MASKQLYVVFVFMLHSLCLCYFQRLWDGFWQSKVLVSNRRVHAECGCVEGEGVFVNSTRDLGFPFLSLHCQSDMKNISNRRASGHQEVLQGKKIDHQFTQIMFTKLTTGSNLLQFNFKLLANGPRLVWIFHYLLPSKLQVSLKCQLMSQPFRTDPEGCDRRRDTPHDVHQAGH